MATVEHDAVGTSFEASPTGLARTAGESRKHRIATVRRQQGISMRSVSRQLQRDSSELKRQEDETADLRISQLREWQQVLEVPLADLLVEPGMPLSRPVMERARLVRIMKTVKAIYEQSDSPAIHRLAETLVGQLEEIMPELADVGSWHSVGQRRSLTEFGRAAERLVSEDAIMHCDWD